MKVLGTPIEALAESGRSRTIIVSDLHLPRVAGAVHARFEALLASTHASASSTRLIVLGDLFDAWVSDAQLRMPVFARVVAALAATRAAGVELLVVHGNRDYLWGLRFARASGARVVAGGLRLPLAGRDALLLHGDELCLRDLAYQRAKLAGPVTRFNLRRPPQRSRRGGAFGLAGRARRVSQDVQAGGARVATRRRRPPSTRRSRRALVTCSSTATCTVRRGHRAARGGRSSSCRPSMPTACTSWPKGSGSATAIGRGGRSRTFRAQHWT